MKSRVEELDRLAHLDPLVPLANRRGMLRELEMMIARHERHDTPAAMLFVDLDGLKMLNDSFGHMGGDAALIHGRRKAARGNARDRLRRPARRRRILRPARSCRREERAARPPSGWSTASPARIACSKASPMPLTVAIGVTLIEKGDTPATVLARADKAMYRVKAAA